MSTRNTKQPKPLGDRPVPLMGETPDEFQRRLDGYVRRRNAEILKNTPAEPGPFDETTS